ncbi:MAG: hypothetical protein H0W86_00035 [Armatimonadetes bacterium]|nr:hypothetical protein [Armatimonadota bacterium]
MSELTPAVKAALDELRAAFPGNGVTHNPDNEGGAYVMVDGLDVGQALTRNESWVAFRLTYQHPEIDVYPHYIRPDVARTDGTALGEGFSGPMSPWEGLQAVQVSRRTNEWNKQRDTASIKLKKVLEWLRTR